MKIKKFNSNEELAQYAQGQVNGKLIALSGGRTYREVLSHWSGDFEGQKFWPVDERVVEFDDEQSNWKMIFENFLEPNDLSFQIKHHQLFLNKQLSPDTKFDRIFLGMGDDGHTASLFPDGPELQSQDFIVDSISPKGVRERVSLGLKAIEQAKKVIMIAYGEDKSEMIFRFIEGDESLPAVLASKRNPNFELLTLV